MAANSQILREYLIALGYKIDAASTKKFDTSLLKTDIGVKGLAKTVIGAGLAVQAFVALWARSMERIYYSSVKAETSAGNLQALSFAASKVGVSGETMTAAIEGMARAVRLNPGLRSFIESMGISTRGRQMGDVMIDVLKQAAKMPFFQGAGIMEMFGMDADTFLLLSKSVDKLEEAARLRKEMAADAGLDVDRAAEVGLEYSQMLRDIGEKFGILKDTVAIALVGPAREFAGVISQVLTDWSRIVKSGDIMDRLKEGMGLKSTGGGVVVNPEAAKRMQSWTNGRRGGGLVTTEPSPGGAPQTGGKQDAASLHSSLERMYGLPPGMLDRVWAAESGRGKYMLSPAGAKGHMGFMPNTAKEFGIEGREGDLAASSAAAAEKLRGLLDRYKGDPRLAAAAYNYGEGNMAKIGNDISRAPLETRLYADKVGGAPVVINQQTDIRVSSDNPETAGRQVAREQTRVGADLARTFQGVVQ